MATIEKILADFETELEEEKKNIREDIKEELGAEEDLVREAAKQGHPGNTAENMKDLEKLEKERKSLKAVEEALRKIETSEIEEKIKEIEEERQETDRKGSEQVMYGYSATVQSLEEAEKLLKGEEYKAEGLGKSAATTFPDSQKKIEKQLGLETELLKDFREKNVHLLLRSSKTLGESNTKTELKNQGLETLKKHKTQLREELRKRAEDLDYLLVNASLQLEETRKRKKGEEQE